ncbi:MAG: DUF501 domain-containing protein [Egibacteraceae bacterium]
MLDPRSMLRGSSDPPTQRTSRAGVPPIHAATAATSPDILRVGAWSAMVAVVDDVLRPAEDASYEAQLGRPAMDERDRELAARMIGRTLRGQCAVAVRCGWGLPAVLRVSPRLEDGRPFPTLFWLACPVASRWVGRVEAQGAMTGLSQRLRDDEALAEAYAAAADRYVAARDTLGGPLPSDAAAGGMPTRVKCLHALYAHHLATRDNPIGAWVGEQVEPLRCPEPCAALTEEGP